MSDTPQATLLITGANRGIGLQLAKEALARGAAVIATARAPDRAEALSALRAGGASLEILPLDVTDDASQAAFAKALSARPVDVLIANAGAYLGHGGLDDPQTDKAAFTETLMTNVYGPFATVRSSMPSLRAARARRGLAKIAVIGSRMGSNALTQDKGNSYPYRASKAAATNLARNLAGPLAAEGIAVGVYHPGWVRTDMGGPEADIGVAESAAGLLSRIDALTLARTGLFEDYAGEPIPL